jgi:hypothetical protein
LRRGDQRPARRLAIVPAQQRMTAPLERRRTGSIA